jgi:DNA-directed RNA polymerase subunit RPC12/RpoP
MFEFCPHCGQSVGQEQAPGQEVVCKHCGHRIGVVPTPPKAAVVDRTEELIRAGTAARCPVCAQVVELRGQGGARTFAPHYATAAPRKVCPGTGKPPAVGPTPHPASDPAPPKKAQVGKDLSAFLTRDRIRVALGRRDAEPQIEELTLEYLDKSDRVRLQIEALREILGPDFRMRDYPPALGRPHLAIWGGAAACVAAGRHPQGGYQSLADAELAQVLDDFRQRKELFFP